MLPHVRGMDDRLPRHALLLLLTACLLASGCVPTFVPGVYRQADGRDLGYPLEFRSQLEVGHRLRAGPRIAVAFSHLSNAGLGSRNPGQESLTINYEWGLSR